MRRRQSNQNVQPTGQVDPSVLLKMKQEIEQKKSKVQSLTGRKDAFYEQLEKQYGCKSLEEADKLIKDMDKELDEKKAKLQQGIQKLENDYDWDF